MSSNKHPMLSGFTALTVAVALLGGMIMVGFGPASVNNFGLVPLLVGFIAIGIASVKHERHQHHH